jgi:hypothetical protein
MTSGEKRDDAITETAQMEDTLPNSDLKINPSQSVDSEKNRKNSFPEARNQLDGNNEPRPGNESPMHHQPAEPKFTSEHDRQIQPQQVAPASPMKRPDQPSISEPTSAAGEQDWKTGLLNAANPNSAEKESKIPSQSIGMSEQPAEDSVGSRKQPQSTATTALSDDNPRKSEETATSFASSKEQLDNGKSTSTQPKLTEPTPAPPTTGPQSPQPAAVAPSSLGHDTETNA